MERERQREGKSETLERDRKDEPPCLTNWLSLSVKRDLERDRNDELPCLTRSLFLQFHPVEHVICTVEGAERVDARA